MQMILGEEVLIWACAPDDKVISKGALKEESISPAVRPQIEVLSAPSERVKHVEVVIGECCEDFARSFISDFLVAAP